MKTFFNILQTITKASAIIYPGETNKFVPLILTGTTDMYTEYNIYSFICKIYNEFKSSKKQTFLGRVASSKFKALNYFFTNKFNTQKQVKCIFEAFSKAQRVYFALIKFVNIYKLKKYPKVVTEDLSMTPLDVNHKNTFVLIQNKSTYLFSLNELIQIIETAIGHAPSFFSDPQYSKNPFNNEKFTNATLYNIYFKMKDGKRVISTIFHLYFLSNFNNELFATNNEAFLREYSIKKYIFTTPALCLHSSVNEMLKMNIYTKKLLIHKDFPKEQLVEIFRPFLYYYYIINYDMRGTHKLSRYKKILYLKLKKFYEYNKIFGRRMIKLKPKSFTFFQSANTDNSKIPHLLDNLEEPNPNSTFSAALIKVDTCNKLKSKIMYNSKHIGFYNIDISEIQMDINEAANMLYYFSTNVEYEDENDEEYFSSDADEDEEDEDDEVQNVVTSILVPDPEVSTLESDDYDDELNNDDELNDDDNDQLNDEDIDILQREYSNNDEEQEEQEEEDDNDSIS